MTKESNKTSFEKIITPGQLIRKRFLRHKLALVGTAVLVVMFLFAFIGPFLSPYGEYEMFYKEDRDVGIYFLAANQELYALNSGDGSVRWYVTLEQEAAGDPVIAMDGTLHIALADNKYVVIDSNDGKILETKEGQEPQLGTDKQYKPAPMLPDKLNLVLEDGFLVANSKETGVKKWEYTGYAPLVTEPLFDAEGTVYSVSEDGEVHALRTERGSPRWTFPSEKAGPFKIFEGPIVVKTLDNRALPGKAHLLGTDRMGLDVLTRLMYGGRISLMVGFVVMLMELTLGILLGGLAGYYGKWVDQLIMRVVDIVNCIPTLPIMLILSSIMLTLRISAQQKVYVLMLLLGLLGWTYVARVVRGQILSLREQDYIIAAEATGLKPMHKIFKHLIPNVMPQLIVIATLGIGDVILLESALSYLGMGLAFPYASWGNMVDAVNDPKILKDFLNIWVPPGLCILLTVMAFNFVGDGLRDAFDPKMKR